MCTIILLKKISFINRYLVKGDSPWPQDSKKLRISAAAFEALRSRLDISPTFVASLADLHKPSGSGFPLPPDRTVQNAFHFWFFLPVRVQVQCSEVQCSDRNSSHASTATGKSQMNPLNYLHLAQSAVDVRGSQIAIYFTFDPYTRTSSTIVINFQDGRWSKVVEEPILRVREGLEQGNRNGCGQDPLVIQAVLLTSALRWWSNVLSSFNDQLISYVSFTNCLFGSVQADSNVRRSSYLSKKSRI